MGYLKVFLGQTKKRRVGGMPYCRRVNAKRPSLQRSITWFMGLILLAFVSACDAGDAAQLGTASTARVLSTGFTIADLHMPSLVFTAGETFEIHFRVVEPGSGILKGYGLSTRLGSEEYSFFYPLPVVQNGRVLLGEAGPLPKQNEAGRFDVEFWVIDGTGRASNRLTTNILVQ